MPKQSKKINLAISLLALIISLTLLLYLACQPIREFQIFDTYQGSEISEHHLPVWDDTKKTVVLVADYRGTEIFDLLAPFYLFNATGEANVYIVAANREPIILRKGLFILPHYTFEEFDQNHLRADVIVIPNLSTLEGKSLSPNILRWIRSSYDSTTRVLSVCDGALTAAASGIYDGHLLTTHASDFGIVSKQFDRPRWVQDVGVTQSRHLYSTAGVSHAVEGSLVVIRDLFGASYMRKVMQKINYPYPAPNLSHQSIPISFEHKLAILQKVVFRKNPRIGVWLEEGMSEFELAAVLDTYHRTFPRSIKTYSPANQPVTSRYGLRLIPTGRIEEATLDELYVLASEKNTPLPDMHKAKIVRGQGEKSYIFDDLLASVESAYGKQFLQVVKCLLDYN